MTMLALRNNINQLLLFILAIFAGIELARFSLITIDDAFITFTYAKNISLGKGAVFVPHEYVEATSSILWALLLVPFEFLHIGSLIGSKVLGALCSILSVFTARGREYPG